MDRAAYKKWLTFFELCRAFFPEARESTLDGRS